MTISNHAEATLLQLIGFNGYGDNKEFQISIYVPISNSYLLCTYVLYWFRILNALRPTWMSWDFVQVSRLDVHSYLSVER